MSAPSSSAADVDAAAPPRAYHSSIAIGFSSLDTRSALGLCTALFSTTRLTHEGLRATVISSVDRARARRGDGAPHRMSSKKAGATSGRALCRTSLKKARVVSDPDAGPAPRD